MALRDFLAFGNKIGQQLQQENKQFQDLELAVKAPALYQVKKAQEQEAALQSLAGRLPTSDPFGSALAQIGGLTGDFSQYGAYGREQTMTPLQRATLANDELKRRQEMEQRSALQGLAERLAPQFSNDPYSSALAQYGQVTGDLEPLFNNPAIQPLTPYQEQQLELQRQQEARLGQQMSMGGGGSGDGGTGVERIAAQLMASDPNLPFPDAISRAATLMKTSGVQYNPQTGQYEAAAGFQDAQGDINASKEFGKAQGKAIFDLPLVENSANLALQSIDAAIGAAGLPNITGILSAFPIIPGGERARAEALLNQVQGQTFLVAYQTLRGGGQITEVEGQKAEQALATLGRAQNSKDVIKGLNDLKGVINRTLEAKRKQATMDIGGGATPQAAPQVAPAVGGFKILSVE